jgi:hypothetical protein
LQQASRPCYEKRTRFVFAFTLHQPVIPLQPVVIRGVAILRCRTYFRTLLLVTTAFAWAAPGVSLHLDSRSLWPLERLSAAKIEGLPDATAYVRKAASLCGIADLSLLPGDLEPRLAQAELDAAKDPNKLISDQQVAEAFNAMSDEFRVTDPIHLTGSDILRYRDAMSAFLPHLFRPKSLSGNRPIGTVVMLYMLLYHGGMTGGWKRVGGPGGFGVTEADPDHPVPGTGKTSNLIAIEYQTAAGSYFSQRSPQDVRAFLDRLAVTLGLPGRR